MKKITLTIFLILFAIPIIAIDITDIYKNNKATLIELDLHKQHADLIIQFDSLITAQDENPITMSLLLIKVGKILRQSGNVGPSLHLFNNAINYYKENPPKNNQENASLVHLLLPYGAAHEEIGLPNLALEIYFEGISRCKDKNDPIFCHFYNNIGVVYYNINQIDKAEEYMHKAEEAAQITHQPLDQFYALNNLSEVYLKKNQLDSALDYALQAIQLINKNNYNYLYYSLQLTIASIYLELKDYDLAYSYLKNTENNNINKHHQTELIYTYDLFSSYYIQKDQITLAQKKIEEAIQIAQKINDKRIIASLYKKMAAIQAKQSNYKQAYEYALFSKNINDSIVEINNNEALKNISQIYTTKESNQKFQERITSLEKENSTLSYKRILLIVVISITLATILLLLLLIRYLKQSNASIKKQQQHLQEQIEQQNKNLENKNRKIITYSINQVKSSEYINTLSKELVLVIRDMNPRDRENRNQLLALKRKITDYEKNNELTEFHYYYEQIHPNFYKNINKAHPSLTTKDKRLCAFIALNLSTREIANITYREVRSVESARNRLRKKMNIPSEISLQDYIKSFI